MIHSLTLAVLLTGFPAQEPVATPEPPTTEEVAREYFRLTFAERDLSAASALLAPEALFVDPTALFGGPLSEGVRGAEAIRALQEGWNVQQMSFDVQLEFFSGAHAVFAGALSWTLFGSEPAKDVPFVTILTVREGRIVERRDYGDYDVVVPGVASHGEVSGKHGDPYFEAYIARDLDAMTERLSPEVVFLDPTAGVRLVGMEALLAQLRRSAADVLEASAESTVRFACRNFVVHAGTGRAAMRGASLGLERERVELEFGYVNVLEIRDAKVLEHRDYADYGAFERAVKEGK